MITFAVLGILFSLIFAARFFLARLESHLENATITGIRVTRYCKQTKNPVSIFCYKNHSGLLSTLISLTRRINPTMERIEESEYFYNTPHNW